MGARPSLEEVQHWVQEFIVDPDGDEAVLRSREDAAGRMVLPSRTLSPVQRVGIYRGMYLLRMNEAIRADFPALEHFLGGAAFEDLVKRYVQAFPSRSYTLSRLREHLPEYIRSASGLARAAFAHDLATLELAMCEAFDASESPHLDPQSFARALQGSSAEPPVARAAVAGSPARLGLLPDSVADPPKRAGLTPDAIANPSEGPDLKRKALAGPPETGWENIRLRPIEALRVLSFRYPVNEYLQSVKDETPHPRTRRKDSWLAVYRRDYTVWRLSLSRQAFSVLSALTQGRSLGDAIRAAGSGRAPLEQQVFKWFQMWIAEGLFSAVEQG